MLTSENKARSRAYFVFLDSEQGRTVPPHLAERFVAHVAGMPDMDRQQFTALGAAFYAAFPDLRHHVIEQVAEGDTVVNRIRTAGTHQGTFQGIPATGRTGSIDVIAIHRYQDGRIVEAHLLFDGLGLLQQLGALPDPTAAVV